MPARNVFYATCCAAQRSSTELIIYSHDAGQCVEIAYPMSRGFRIVPSGIAAYLIWRHCFWECFCGLTHDHPTPVRFVTQRPFVTFEITAADFLVCSSFLLFLLFASLFSVNLNETRHTALLESSYDDFPTHVQGNIPNIALLLTAFWTTITSLPFGHTEIVPYFVNYLGSHSSMHPQAPVMMQNQLPFFMHEVVGNRRHILLGRARQPTRHVTNIALPQPPHTPLSVSRIKHSHMHALAAGMGISRYDAMGLTEECDSCGKWFMASALRGHIVGECSER
ncbi:hypothetical protein P692DRAFT_20757672 [Suillus brevipes Sb2]|nr:hypothetical protein P692DRAFT_20757672 [Suillus brevipes Sb2]